MEQDKLNLLNDVNQAIMKFRGIYSAWSNTHNISYHEMLVIYSIRSNGFCTQKQICDDYRLPRQTIHNVIYSMRQNEILQYSKEHSTGREKAFVLSEKGKAYAASLIASLENVEARAVDTLGTEKLTTLISLLLEYERALSLEMKKAE